MFNIIKTERVGTQDAAAYLQAQDSDWNDVGLLLLRLSVWIDTVSNRRVFNPNLTKTLSAKQYNITTKMDVLNQKKIK